MERDEKANERSTGWLGYSATSQRRKGSVELNVNGRAVQAEVDPAMPLLWVLRDVLQLTGTKFGCGVAACGACTVRIDGQAVRSCVTPVSSVAGKAIQTIEGLGSP